MINPQNVTKDQKSEEMYVYRNGHQENAPKNLPRYSVLLHTNKDGHWPIICGLWILFTKLQNDLQAACK